MSLSDRARAVLGLFAGHDEPIHVEPGLDLDELMNADLVAPWAQGDQPEPQRYVLTEAGRVRVEEV